MKRIILIAAFLLTACATWSEPTKPSYEDGHALPHAAPCHPTESQGQGGYVGQCVAGN